MCDQGGDSPKNTRDRKAQTIDRRKCAEAASKTFDVQNDVTHKKTDEARGQANSTTILPIFCPWKRRMKALHCLAWQSNGSGITDVGYSMLFAQEDHAQEAIVNRQRAVLRVIDKAQRPELVHEIIDPRPGGADHLGQVFLIDSGMDRFGSAFLAKMRQQ